MKNTNDILNEVRSALDIREEIDLTELDLYELLEKTRNRYHPDKTTNEDVKISYEEKFKYFTGLLKKFGESITEKRIDSSNELTIYKQNLTIIDSKQEIISLQERVDLLKIKITNYKNRISKLEDEIGKLRGENIKEETNKLIDLYKPKRVNIYSVGLVALLGIFFNLLLQVEKVANLFAKHAPFLNEATISYFTFSLLMLFSIILYIKYLGERAIVTWTKKVSLTSFFNKLFLDEEFRDKSWDFSEKYLQARNPYDKYEESESYYEYINRNRGYFFKETQLLDFLEKEFAAKNALQNFIRKKILNLDSSIILDSLKNIVLFNLINRDFIQLSGNDKFDKIFRIEEKSF